MKKRNVCIILLGTLLFLMFSNKTFSEDLSDEDSFKCHKGIVSLGDTKYSVKEKCGEPTFKDKFDNNWVYDRGPSYFIYYIKFSSGTVLRISSGKHGQ